MAILDLTLARAHLRADNIDAEDVLIQQYIDSAISICEGFCNRRFYENAALADVDYLAAINTMVEVDAVYEALEDNDDLSCDIKSSARDRWITQRGAVSARMNGIVADGAVIAAILLTVGHLYKNRSSVVVSALTPVEVPLTARRILEPYLWIGPLAGWGS